MVFSSPEFIFIFLPITLFVYYILPNKLRNFWLMLTSFIFYSWSGAKYAVLILLCTVINYIFGILIGEPEFNDNNNKLRKYYFICAILINLFVLTYFKYYNFLIDNIIYIGKLFKFGLVISNEKILLPVGISFFTFQIMSYIIDVYMGSVKPQKNFIHLSLYIMLFPQLIAGPIVRYIDVAEQIVHRIINPGKFYDGIKRFILGFAKKVFIANNVGYVADYIFNAPQHYNMGTAWLAIFCYALQIYYDFSGYSDMAIGLGKLFGFDFLENFKYPYIANSIRDFWRRWHISLSTWFRDYLYIPLGGNRKGEINTYRNLLMVFFMTGLWHGASWNFVIWGLYHGFFLIIERSGFGKLLDKLPLIIQRIYTLFVVLIGWVFFRMDTLQSSVKFIHALFSFNLSGTSYVLRVIDNESIFIIIIAIIFSTPIYNYLKDTIERTFISKINSIAYLIARISYNFALILIFIVSILYMSGTDFNPFIYFRF
ncbi:peptidoglycan O-acetyltransferase [Oxobacter pfennigii]|uniref:Peptidoglycan O-acetyltransferase n=1 Tax=Oxobacter pfennigii TaxID=36849 RepID=A0A0P8YVG1_9CLOT|nr:MBOAT family O-acyltransferase [Oxobacter pfennigii]KPU43694.1 peptidoglycan O-acetyltransferase [Oxobacter pfennigii]